ncbi:hypothetical protein QJS04_geneDACA000894 [Acorus gramineus]|uniref:Reverse transcriptase domain-containing protein n=1 Tax=Acorus gramineus TaxID=55184 RepID=A0AAV9ACM5_ACOGR|nr:hypothetical protein QJS04_geneDACA000894 [Acorus gramineus]
MEYRPISVCDTKYKILAHILVHRLKPVLMQLVGKEQGAFVPHRSIHAHLLLFQDMLHSLQHRKGKHALFAAKIDLASAYDSIEWLCLDKTMRVFGFPPKWRSWIMECVTQSRSAILLNGSSSQWIYPGRGLRQGDPLSPYLFVLVAEVMSLSHILYADDLVVMSTATPTQCQAVRQVLQDVHHMTGLTVSWPKSTVRFSPQVHPRWRRWMSRILRLKAAAGGCKYLGVPVIGERSRRARCSFVADHVKQHIQGWKSQQLTMAGRLLLIKSVLNALPIHLLQATTLALSTIHDIEKATRSFLWSGEARGRSVHLINWETVTSPHSLGGLGLKRLQVVKKAVLAKLAFQILLQPNITGELLAFKHGWAGNPWEIRHTSRCAPVWKSLSTGLKLIRFQLHRIPGVLSDTDLLRDPWYASIPFSRIPTFINMQAACLDYRLSDVVDSNGWNVQALHNIFPAYWVDLIVRARVPRCNDDGRPAWVWDGSVLPIPRLRDFYSTLDNPVRAPANQRWGHIWRLPVFPKVKLFLWKLCWNRLPTICYLDSIGLRMDITCLRMDITCPVCEATFETSFHLFCECSFTVDCWRLSPSSMLPPQEVWTTQSWIEVFEDRHWTHTHSNQVKRLFFIAMLWGLWKMRDQVLFKRKTPSMIWVVSQAITHTRE